MTTSPPLSPPPPPPPPPPTSSSSSSSSPPREGPAWLPHFLTGNYFSPCARHISSKNERNHFCIDCVSDGPMCHIGLQNEHASHRSLQVRRASHMDAVRVHDIQKLADISNIQTYTINSAKIVFLLSRPQDRVAKAATHWCLNCNRTLTDPTTFCSISCKLAAARSNPSVSLALPLPSHEEQADVSAAAAAGGGSSSDPVTVPVTAAAAAVRGSRTCCLEDEPMMVKSMTVEGLTDEQKMSKAGKKAQLPLKKRKADSSSSTQSGTETDTEDQQENFGSGDVDVAPPRSPISVLVPHSPQHSGISSLIDNTNSVHEPLTPQKVCESPRSAKQRRKGLPHRSPLV